MIMDIIFIYLYNFYDNVDVIAAAAVVVVVVDDYDDDNRQSSRLQIKIKMHLMFYIIGIK